MTKRSWLLPLILAATAAVVSRADDRLLLEAKLNGQPLKLAFDTGAESFIIFQSTADRLRLKTISPPADAKLKPGAVPMGQTEPVTVELLKQVLPDVRLRVFTDPGMPPGDVDGVVGWPVLRRNIWLLNLSASRFTSLEELPAESARWIKLRELQDRPLLCLELPQKHRGKTAYIGVDTGADNGIALSPDEWEKWKTAHRREPVTLVGYYMPGVGPVVGELAWADEIDLGGLILRGVTLREMNKNETAIQPANTVAVLGFDALKRMDGVFDGKNGVAYLNPLKAPVREAAAHNRLGAVFIPSDPQQSDALVAHIAKGSPAEKAGLRDGDVLLKINQLDVTAWRTQPGILPLSRFFEQAPGTKLQLTLRRDGKVVSVDAVLRNIIGPQPKTH
jgi:hypothetical protein